jgi:ATP-dependent RNA helicase DHX37/DHR1
MLLQLALWQLRHAEGAASAGAAAGLGPVGGVSVAAASQALPYAVALAAVLSVESPFMHIDALQTQTEAAAADAEAAQSPAAAAAAAAAAQADKEQQQQSAEAKADNKKKMQRASAAHHRFRSPHGDSISALNVLSAYEAAAASPGGVEAFCADNFLHARHLREMSQLRQQLGRTLLQLQQQQQGAAHLPAAAAAIGSSQGAQQLLQQLMGAVQQVGQEQLVQPLPQPPPAVLDVLRRALAAGWCDQVSRRVRSADYIARMANQGRLARHATRYLPACLSDEEVFLHPRSCLSSTAPEYVVYMDVVRTAKRPYMAHVTAIEPQWLADFGTSLCTGACVGCVGPWGCAQRVSMCTRPDTLPLPCHLCLPARTYVVSEPLAEPAPVYQPELDAVLAWHEAAYSPHDWALPRLLLPHPDPTTRAAVFAAALLGGRVLPALSALAGVLVAPAASAARPELAGLARVGELVSALKGQGVFSRASLASAWGRQPAFLQPQLAMWLPKQQRHALETLWPALLREAADGQAGGGPKSKGSKKRKKKGGGA